MKSELELPNMAITTVNDLPFLGGGGGGACGPVTIFFGGTGATPTFFGGAATGT